MDEARPAPALRQDDAGEVEDLDLLDATHVHRHPLRRGRGREGEHGADGVLHVQEAPPLPAVPVDGQRSPGLGGRDEPREDHPVALRLPGPHDVEEADDGDPQVLRAGQGERIGLPRRLGEGVDLPAPGRVEPERHLLRERAGDVGPVDLAAGGEEHAGARPRRRPEHDGGPLHVPGPRPHGVASHQAGADGPREVEDQVATPDRLGRVLWSCARRRPAGSPARGRSPADRWRGRRARGPGGRPRGGRGRGGSRGSPPLR